MHPDGNSQERFGLLLGLAGMCLFAGTLPATRLAVLGFDPWLLTAARAAIAGTTGLIVLTMGRRCLPRPLRLEMFAAGLCTVVGFPLFAALAMMTVPAAHGGVVLGILPLATTAAATVLAHERPSRGFWLASAAGAAIVLIFVFRSDGEGTLVSGDLFLLATIIAGAIGYTLSGRLAAHMPGWEVISWQAVMFLPAAAPATWLLWPAQIAAVPTHSWLGLAYVGFVSQFAAFVVFNAGLAIGGIARVGQVMLLQPFVIVALAQPINGEPITVETLLFAAAVVATILIGQQMRVVRR